MGKNTSGEELFDSVHGIIRDTFPKNISLKFDISPGLWRIIGDSTQLHQVLFNLCLNARDAMPEGGQISLSARNENIDSAQTAGALDLAKGAYVRIEVTDTGVGIDPEVLEKIYDPFFTTKEVGKGSGLGLSTSLNIIKNHGGSIDTQSELDRGTEFRLHLPAIASLETDEPPAHQEVDQTLPSGNGETILVVDDEPGIVSTLAMSLEHHGYNPITATSGPEGSRIFQEKSHEIDAVITDMMMPGLDGASLIQQVVKRKPDTVIIAASGISAQQQAAKAAGCPERNFLMKPFSIGKILGILDNALME